MSSTEKVHYGIQSKQTTWVPVYWEQSPDGAEPLCGLRQTLSDLSSTPQDLLPRPCKFSTSGRGSFDIPTSWSSDSCCRLWNLSKREICQKSFYFFLISVWYCSIIFLSYDMWLILEITFINLVVCWNSFIFLH